MRISSAEQLAGVLVDLVDRGVLVAAVEVAQEVAAVLAVEGQQRRAPRPSVRSDEAERGRRRAGGGWRATSSAPPRCDAISVFSRSNAASWRSGASTWLAQAVLAGSGRCVRPAWCCTRAWLDDRRQVDLGGRSGPSRSTRGSKQNVALVVGVERRPTARAGGRRRRSPRTRRRRRRARRSRAPARPRSRFSSSVADHSACLPRSGSAREHLLGPVEHVLGPRRAGPAPGRGRGTTTRARRWAGPRCRRAGAR